jgi:hypothetical protein
MVYEASFRGGSISADKQGRLTSAYLIGTWPDVNATLTVYNYPAPHDLAVSLDSPSFLELGNTALLNATVRNIGLNNETNVELQLLINDTVVSSILIPELLIEESYTFSYLWTPSVEGVYNVTAYANPVPDENITANNLKTRFVRVLILPEILIVNDDDGGNWIRGTSLQEFVSALGSLGYDYWVWNESSDGNPPLDFLVKFKLVIWTCGDFWSWAVDQSDAATLQSYLAQGGNILLEGEDIGYNHDADEFMVNVAHATYQVDNTGAPGLTVTDPTHPVTFNLPTSFTWLIDPPYDDGVTPTNGGVEVIRYTGTTWTAVTVFGENVGGKVVYYAFPLYCLPEPHRTTLAINSINWLLGIRYEHELGVKLEAPDILQLGKTAVLNATVYNYGVTNETDVKLQLLINNTEVYSVIIPELLSGSFYTFNYSWTPTVEGLYNVSVYTPPIPGEEITTNNLATKNIKVMAVKVYQLSHTPRRMHGDENYIYYTAEDGGTYRINKVTGVEEFFSQYGHDLIWVEGNYVYVGEGYELSGSSTNDIYKYDKNGNLIWHVHPTYEGPWGGATFQFGVGKYYIYAVAGPYAYGAISKEDGSIVWVSQGGVTRYPDMVIADLKNDVVIECGYWSPNTIQRISKVDGHIIWQRKGPTEEMGECTAPVDITDDAIWIRWCKGEYPNHYFYALAKWDRNTGALIQAFPELPYNMIWHVGPEGSLTFDYPYEAGNALVWNYQTNELCKVNTNTWEIYWSTDIGYPMEYCINRLFIDKEFIYLRDKYDTRIIYQYRWTTPVYYTLTIETAIGGTTNPTPGIYTYVNGTQVVITAIPNNGFSFDYWLLDGVKTTQNPITIIMNANHTLEAYFIDDIPPEISEPWQDPLPDNVQPLQNVTVWVNVTDYGTGIKNVTLWYSINNGTTWTPKNMTQILTNTFQATIPGYEYSTWVTYKIIAYDNAGNNATKDNNGYGYKYHVIPEYPSTLILVFIMATTLITTSILKIKKRRQLL